MKNKIKVKEWNSDSDMPGEDIEDVPRYPRSRRTSYIRQGGATILIYHNPCKSEQALRFHRSSMQKKGWWIGDRFSVSSKLSSSIRFFKMGQDCMKECIINVSPYKYGSHTLVIYHQKEGKSER